jgi:hypothetical protein
MNGEQQNRTTTINRRDFMRALSHWQGQDFNDKFALLRVRITGDMKRDCLVVLSTIVAALAGCDTSQPQPQNQPLAKPHYQRFVPIPAAGFFTEGVPWNGYFALDTKTGALCSTMKGRVFKGPSEWANDVPICEQLLAANPDN